MYRGQTGQIYSRKAVIKKAELPTGREKRHGK